MYLVKYFNSFKTNYIICTIKQKKKLFPSLLQGGGSESKNLSTNVIKCNTAIVKAVT